MDNEAGQKRVMLPSPQSKQGLSRFGTVAKAEVLPVTGQQLANDCPASLLRNLCGSSLVPGCTIVLDSIDWNFCAASLTDLLFPERNTLALRCPADLSRTCASISINPPSKL